MHCMNCGTYLPNPDIEYCPRCGSNVLIQKKIDYLSKYYYNQGLEKASIRDLSGAMTCLRQSLTYNKNNIEARNLLGLVYFETGEVVAALSEWVISKNLKPNKNLASEYINKLQANPNKLEAINETIKKYNHALNLCREGHDDMAAIQLKRILAQNSKLIKGYHLLALIQMKEHEWSKARRTLRKAARIDKTNTTTLRFLREIDEQTGVTTRLDHHNRRTFRLIRDEKESYLSDIVTPAQAYREHPRVSVLFTSALGFAAGAAALWFLIIPSIRQGIYREANNQLITYSESLASQGAELTKAQGDVILSGNSIDQMNQQIQLERETRESYENLLIAYAYLQEDDIDDAYVMIKEVNKELLSDKMKNIYNVITNRTGVPDSAAASQEGDSGDYSGEYTEDYNSGDEYYEDYSDEGYYEDYSDYSYTGEDYYDEYS